MPRPLWIRLVVAATLAVLMSAAACSSGSDEPVADDTVGADGADEGSGDNVDSAEADAGGDDPGTGTQGSTVLDGPTVLLVNDDIVAVPVFDAPNGTEAPVYDVNEIDDIELEYPLLGETDFGNRLALAVREFDASGDWALVDLPVRPNGSTGWVQTALFTVASPNYRIAIDLSDGQLQVFQGDELLRESPIAHGRTDRPTPAVSTYIDEVIPGSSVGPAFGDWVLSLAAFSESVGTFNGGLPKLAIAGTDEPDRIGQQITSGIVQVPNDMIVFLAETVPPGTPVDITD